MMQPMIMKMQPRMMQGLRPYLSTIVGLCLSVSHLAKHWLLRMRPRTYTVNMERMEPMVNILVKRPSILDFFGSVPILSKYDSK